jgi:ankyrin repeat protein
MLVHEACRKGDINLLKSLAETVDLSERDNHNWTPIHYACYMGNVEIVEFLIDKVNLEVENDHKWKPIHCACCYGHADIVKLLLDRVELEAEDDNGWRPIHYACYYGHVEIVRLLLDRVNLEATTKKGYRPIHCIFISINEIEFFDKYFSTKILIEITKLLIDGFISDKIYHTLPKIDLFCSIENGKTLLELTNNTELLEFIETKMRIVKRTLFPCKKENFCDICIY